MFINYDEWNDYLPLPTPILFQRYHFSLTKGLGLYPRSEVQSYLWTWSLSRSLKPASPDLAFSLEAGSVLIPSLCGLDPWQGTPLVNMCACHYLPRYACKGLVSHEWHEAGTWCPGFSRTPDATSLGLLSNSLLGSAPYGGPATAPENLLCRAIPCR